MENKTEKTRFETTGVIKSAKENSGISQKTDKPYTNYLYEIQESNGNVLKMSTFNKDFYDAWKVEENVKVVYDKVGIYNTLVGFDFNEEDMMDLTPIRPGEVKPIKTSKVEPKRVEQTFGPSSKDLWIIRQSSLKAAIELCVGGKITEDKVLSQAVKYEEWVLREDLPDY